MRPYLPAVLLAAVLLGGCAGDTDAPDPSDTASGSPDGADAPCLVTAEQLTEITGVEQTLSESDAPPVDPDADPEDELLCRTTVDERDTTIEWQLSSSDLAAGGTLTHNQLRDYVARGDAEVTEVDLDAGTPAWVGQREEAGAALTVVAASLDDRWLSVELSGNDEAVDRAGARDEAVAVTSALVDAVAARR